MATNPNTLRFRQTVILSRMLLILMRVTFRAHRHGPNNVGAVFSLILISWAIRVGGSTRHPATISQIGRLTSLPRPTVRRAVARLLALGTITKAGHGYVSDPQWINAKIDQRAVGRMVRITTSTASKLRKMR